MSTAVQERSGPSPADHCQCLRQYGHDQHPLDVPFTQVLKAVSRWGSGSKDLVAAMERSGTPTVRPR
jgi:hypothetical protein